MYMYIHIYVYSTKHVHIYIYIYCGGPAARIRKCRVQALRIGKSDTKIVH